LKILLLDKGKFEQIEIINFWKVKMNLAVEACGFAAAKVINLNHHSEFNQRIVSQFLL